MIEQLSVKQCPCCFKRLRIMNDTSNYVYDLVEFETGKTIELPLCVCGHSRNQHNSTYYKEGHLKHCGCKYYIIHKKEVD